MADRKLKYGFVDIYINADKDVFSQIHADIYEHIKRQHIVARYLLPNNLVIDEDDDLINATILSIVFQTTSIEYIKMLSIFTEYVKNCDDILIMFSEHGHPSYSENLLDKNYMMHSYTYQHMTPRFIRNYIADYSYSRKGEIDIQDSKNGPQKLKIYVLETDDHQEGDVVVEKVNKLLSTHTCLYNAIQPSVIEGVAIKLEDGEIIQDITEYTFVLNLYKNKSLDDDFNIHIRKLLTNYPSIVGALIIHNVDYITPFSNTLYLDHILKNRNIIDYGKCENANKDDYTTSTVYTTCIEKYIK